MSILQRKRRNMSRALLHGAGSGVNAALLLRGSIVRRVHLSLLITLQLNFLLVCVCVYVTFDVIDGSRNKPSPPPPPPAAAPPPPPQPAVPPPSAAANIGQQPQQVPAGMEETDDTMKNLRKTFAGIFGNM